MNFILPPGIFSAKDFSSPFSPCITQEQSENLMYIYTIWDCWNAKSFGLVLKYSQSNRSMLGAANKTIYVWIFTENFFSVEIFTGFIF